MPNAKDAVLDTPQRLLVVGPVGGGKTQQIATLPGRKFVYIFEPNALPTLRGFDIEYEPFLITKDELDPMLKGFNKDSKDDKLPLKAGQKAPEPVQMLKWVDHFNAHHDKGFFNDFDWLCFDSLTMFKEILMDRQMFLNKRFGAIEDRADYRIAGSKIVEIFQMLAALPINVYCTGHLNTYEDEKTKRVLTQIDTPGSSRRGLPMLFSNIWEARATTDTEQKYVILTRPEPRGFQDIRTTIRGLNPIEDVTIKDFSKPENFGIGALLKKHKALPELRAFRNAPAPTHPTELNKSPVGEAAKSSASASSPSSPATTTR